jgi:hypothetical protein
MNYRSVPQLSYCVDLYVLNPDEVHEQSEQDHGKSSLCNYSFLNGDGNISQIVNMI